MNNNVQLADNSVTLSTRVKKEISVIISLIAHYEDRTVSKVIQRLVERGLKQYLKDEDFLDNVKVDEKIEKFISELSQK